jgi:O-antigen ligase
MSQPLAMPGAQHPAVRRLLTWAGRPSTWVASAIAVVPLGSHLAPSGASATPSDVVLIVAAGIALLELLRGESSASGAHALRSARSVPGACLLLLAVVSLVTSLTAANFPASVIGGVRFLELFALGPFAIMVALRTRLDAVVLFSALVGLALFEGAIGVWQFLTGNGAGINGESIRAVGTFGAYNIVSLAVLCGLGIVTGLGAAVVLDGRRRLMAGAGAGLLALPLAASLSRASYVAVAVAAVVVVSRGRLGRLLIGLACGGFLLALVIPPLVASGSELGMRVGSLLSANAEPDQSVKDRLSLWSAATEMATDRPLTGVGPRAFPDHRDAYADLNLLGSSDISFGSDFQRVALNSPHDLYLLIASEQGLLAAAAYITVFAVLLARNLVIAARRRSDGSTALSLIAVGLLTFQLVNSITADLGGPGSFFIALTMGVAARGAADVDLTGRTPSWRPDAVPGRPGHPAAAPVPLESPV